MPGSETWWTNYLHSRKDLLWELSDRLADKDYSECDRVLKEHGFCSVIVWVGKHVLLEESPTRPWNGTTAGVCLEEDGKTVSNIMWWSL